MKRWLSVVLVLLVLFSFAVPVMADEVADSEIIVNVDDDSAVDLCAEEQETRGSYVELGEITIFAHSTHAFIMIENTTNATLDVGPYQLAANSKMTLGTFSAFGYFPRYHNGIYVNYESHLLNEGTTYTGRVSLTMPLTPDGLGAISQILYNRANNTWANNNNCYHFAVKIWNAAIATSNPVYTLTANEYLINSITGFSVHRVNLSYPSCSLTNTYYINTAGQLKNITEECYCC